jgi:putative Holliday junction resolvase
MNNNKRILALDFGLKRTGLAITDEHNIIASGLKTLDSKVLMSELHKLVPANNVGIIVLGEPKRLNNSPSHVTENVHILFEVLKKEFPQLNVTLHDERFTSKMASQAISMSGLSKNKKQDKGLIDEVSATILLQSYMSSIQFRQY